VPLEEDPPLADRPAEGASNGVATVHPEIERAHAAQVPYVEPASLQDPEGRRVRRRPNAALHESFQTQRHISTRSGRRTQTYAGALLPPPPEDSRDPIIAWFLTAWNPLGRPSTLDENRSAHSALVATIEAAGGTVLDVVTTVPPDRSWLEETVRFRGFPGRKAIELAADFGQPAITAIGLDSLTIVPTGLHPGVDLVTHDYLVDPVTVHCPMNTDDEPGARCTSRGGPWTSSSIHAAALWSTHRDLVVSRLGCDTCDAGGAPIAGSSGAPQLLEPPALASRSGGYSWPSGDRAVPRKPGQVADSGHDARGPHE
jgi:hypothetical protein